MKRSRGRCLVFAFGLAGARVLERLARARPGGAARFWRSCIGPICGARRRLRRRGRGASPAGRRWSTAPGCRPARWRRSTLGTSFPRPTTARAWMRRARAKPVPASCYRRTTGWAWTRSRSGSGISRSAFQRCEPSAPRRRCRSSRRISWTTMGGRRSRGTSWFRRAPSTSACSASSMSAPARRPPTSRSPIRMRPHARPSARCARKAHGSWSAYFTWRAGWRGRARSPLLPAAST